MEKESYLIPQTEVTYLGLENTLLAASLNGNVEPGTEEDWGTGLKSMDTFNLF